MSTQNASQNAAEKGAAEKNTTEKSIQQKVVFVTGAAQGIGRAIAERLANDGHHIALFDLDEAALQETKQLVEKSGVKALAITGDVTSKISLQEAVDETVDKLGDFDVMINNAGIAGVAPLEDVSEEEIDRHLDVNYKGTLFGIQVAAKKLKELGHGGKILAATSIAAHESFPMIGVYASTKFAVRALIYAAAQELGSAGITVNGYSPGVVGTGMWEKLDRGFAEYTGAEIGETYKKYVDGITLGRASVPEDVAGFVSYLVGPDADYMTGQTPIIDGGIVYR
ncbi:acetoin reductase [Corynebacterium propinquum]|uniref:acetoin reductase n=1 Tax=Corynebacterium propinquum TaxID=43769 RepID=UPI0011A45119|nr:acetoin reductase [Corynebacterium propinquum]